MNLSYCLSKSYLTLTECIIWPLTCVREIYFGHETDRIVVQKSEDFGQLYFFGFPFDKVLHDFDGMYR